MKYKKAFYAAVPLLGVGIIAGGLSIASAHGFPGPRGKMQSDPAALFQEQATLPGVSVDEVKDAWAAGKNLEKLAQEKGISKGVLRQKMKAAQDTKMKEHLAALVSDGKLTQEQADERIAQQKQHEAQHDITLASALGITTAELDAYQAAGKSIDDIITEKGLAKDTVMKALATERLSKETESIQALVTKGVITQAQADTRIATLKNSPQGFSHEGFGHFGQKPFEKKF